jgi:hypothetical protein
MTRMLLEPPIRLLGAVLLAAGLGACAEEDLSPPLPRWTPPPRAAAAEAPEPPEYRAIRTGETSGGRPFRLFVDDTGQLGLLIEGEEAISLDWWEDETYCGLAVDSVEVEDLEGSPDLVYVKWINDARSCHGSSSYGARVSARGAAGTVLFAGGGVKWGGDRYLFVYRNGTYDLTYEDDVLSVLEGVKEGNTYSYDDHGHCHATETRLARSYLIVPGVASRLTCERFKRSAATWSETWRPCVPEMDALLDATPWERQVMSPEQRERTCGPIGGKL